MLLGNKFLRKLISLGALSSLGACLELTNLYLLSSLINKLVSKKEIDETGFNIAEKLQLSIVEFLILLFVSFLISTFLNIYISYVVIRTSQSYRVDISQRLLAKIFSTLHLNDELKDVDIVTKEIVSESDALINYLISPIINIVHSVIFVCALFIFILYNHGVIIIIPISLVVFSYIILYFLTRKTVTKIANLRDYSNTERFKSVAASIRGYRDVIVYKMEKQASSEIKGHFERFSEAISKYNLLAKLPRFYVEFFIILSVIFFVQQIAYNPNINSGDYLLLLMPSMLAMMKCVTPAQNIYNSLLGLRFSDQITSRFISILSYETDGLDNTNAKKFVSVDLQNVSYEKDDKYILKDISLKIRKGDKILIMGPSGSGKSTLLDLISGFKKPSHGVVNCRASDGTECAPEPYFFTYIQQSPFIFEGDFLENISLKSVRNIANVPDGSLADALSMADLANDFQLEALKDRKLMNYGANLSGGQRQRISIARGIYNYSNMLLLDEFTSAIDVASRHRIYSALAESELTVVATTHDMEAVKYFDTVVCLKNE